MKFRQRLREERRRLFGAKPTKAQIILACQQLLENIGEYHRGFTEEDLEKRSAEELLDVAEDLVHEMAHHVALTGNVEFESERALSISRAIEALLPAQRAGNEIDAIAIEADALWWLYIPLTRKGLSRILPSNFDLDLAPRSIVRLVQALREAAEPTELAKGLAFVIYEEIELQKREARQWEPASNLQTNSSSI